MSDTDVPSVEPVAPVEPSEPVAQDRRKKWILWGAGGVALAVVIIAVVLLLPRGREPGKIPSSETARLAALGPQTAQLVALLERGEQTVYHARYRTVTPEVAGGGTSPAASMVIELWRSPPRLRQDVTVSAAGQTATSAAFLLPEGGVGCTREDAKSAWTCTDIPNTETTTDTLARQITQQVSDGPITVRSDRVAGLAVQCFNLPVSEATAEVCVTADGIPALIRSGGTSIELVELVKEVPAGVFTPPVG
jgi:hypothetical protein